MRSDPNLLRRLIQNLVSNAIKYTRDGRVLIGVRHRGARVQVQVVDTGIGIPSAKFRTVFKEFARLDEGVRAATGLGLGLSIVDRIARVLNHPVHLNSRPGRGTDFRVEIPREARPALAPATEARAVSSVPGFRLDGLTVLCIDNETSILEGMNLLLGGWGCDVRTATSLAAAREFAGAGGQGRRHHRRLSSRRRNRHRGNRPAESLLGRGRRRPAHHGGPLRGSARRGTGCARLRSRTSRSGPPRSGPISTGRRSAGAAPRSRARHVLCISASAPMRDRRMTACVRLSTSSFCRTAETCALIVASDTPSS